VPVDLRRVRSELAGEALVAPLPAELAVAIVADVFRLAGLPPLTLPEWQALRERGGTLWAGQLGMLAHALSATCLGPASVEALRASGVTMARALAGFFTEIAPLEAEMVRANHFRQEEFIRWWTQAIGGGFVGEEASESAARLAQLDFKKTLAEYQAAEKARQAEAEKRERELKAAAEREAEARGWRE
jgi:hypothetical protein